jgi:hypothetical protein
MASIGNIVLQQGRDASPDCDAAFCATARLTSFEPKISPSTLLPGGRRSAVAPHLIEQATATEAIEQPSRPSRPAGCAAPVS